MVQIVLNKLIFPHAARVFRKRKENLLTRKLPGELYLEGGKKEIE